VEGEAPAEWYDESFEAHSHWKHHYSLSPWYYIWTVIVDRVQGVAAPSVLDIGCGPGQLAAFLRDRGVTNYVGIDFSPKRIEWARAAVPEVRFEVADVYESDLLERVPYNVVICTEFLEHVDRDVDVTARIRPGSRFIGTVPNFGGGSHVRHFGCADEVNDRYARYFEHVRVDTFHMPSPGQQQFLIDGVIGKLVPAT
jgi:2-polyprenyl-3-methyl-5-hydroxy-6-metoxy-1,4-benzoquinol methylase